MVQMTVWPMPYWGTALLLCLPYIPLLWAIWKCAKRGFSDDGDGWGVVCIITAWCLLFAAVGYGFAPGFYFRLSLQDVQWAYLQGN